MEKNFADGARITEKNVPDPAYSAVHLCVHFFEDLW